MSWDQNAKAEYVYTVSTSTTLDTEQAIQKKNHSSQQFGNMKLIYYYSRKWESTGQSIPANTSGTLDSLPILIPPSAGLKPATTCMIQSTPETNGVAQPSTPTANYAITPSARDQMKHFWDDGHGYDTEAKEALYLEW
jgi:hypothetical protein